jgi:hypothetical protein
LELTDPDHRTIYRFIRALFQAAQLTAECAIITLVYIERLLNYGEIDLCHSNWRRIVLGAIMLASKVWDDQAVSNYFFENIFDNFTFSRIIFPTILFFKEYSRKFYFFKEYSREFYFLIKATFKKIMNL